MGNLEHKDNLARVKLGELLREAPGLAEVAEDLAAVDVFEEHVDAVGVLESAVEVDHKRVLDEC